MMAFHGSLQEFSSSDILQLFGTQKKSGCLILERGDRRTRVFVKDGRIVSTRDTGSLANDLLMRFLRRIRRLSEEQLRGIATLHQESGRDLEDLLLNGRYLEGEELASIIERQILEDLTEIVEWTDGTYRFDPAQPWPFPPIARLNMEAALIEAARRADESRRFHDTFRDLQQIVSVCNLPAPESELTEEESELFAVIDGQHTVAEVVAAAPLSEYEAFEAMQQMLETGWIELLARRESAPADAAIADTAPATGQTPRPLGPVGGFRHAWRPVSLPRELAVAAMVVALLVGLRFVAQAVQHPLGARGRETVFAAAQVRDVRSALELYRREQGRYPERLEDLVTEQWLEDRQLVVNGERIRYRLNPERGDYDLMLSQQP
jgi:hypothetical protein